MESDAIEEFVREVRAYCEFVNGAATLGRAERLKTARTRLLALYSSGLTLPEVPKLGDPDAGPNPLPPQGWRSFEDREVYWEVFDPYVEDELVCGSLQMMSSTSTMMCNVGSRSGTRSTRTQPSGSGASISIFTGATTPWMHSAPYIEHAIHGTCATRLIGVAIVPTPSEL